MAGISGVNTKRNNIGGEGIRGPWRAALVADVSDANSQTDATSVRRMGIFGAFGRVWRVLEKRGAKRQQLPKTVVTYKVLEYGGRARHFFASKLLIPVSDAEFLVHNAVPFRIKFSVCVSTGPKDFVYFNQPRKKTTM